MSKLRMKIAALFTASISILPTVSSNVVKANDILQKEAFVKNFQKKNITVYRTADNRLVDANLNYINVEGKPLNKDESKVSVPKKFHNIIVLHPVLKFMNMGLRYKFTKTLRADGKSYVFATNEIKGVKITPNLLYFDPNRVMPWAMFSHDLELLRRPDLITAFGDALPELETETRPEVLNLLSELQKKCDSIEKNQIARPKKADDSIDNNQMTQNAAQNVAAPAVAGALGGVGLATLIWCILN